MSLCDSEDKIECELINYTKSILNSLDLSHGAAHNEVMLTKEGPVLIELNALNGEKGFYQDEAFKQALEYTQRNFSSCLLRSRSIYGKFCQ